jgi:hypothetical protein
LNKLPLRLQRILALRVVPAALLAIWTGVLWPIWHAYEAQVHWRATAARTLARQRGLAGIEKAVHAQLDALSRLKSWQRLYRASPDGSAIVALQTDISEALTASHARAQNFAPIGTTQSGSLRKVGLRVVASMTIDQLREFLRQAGELTHFVRIEQLVINAPPVQSPQENPPFTVTLDIFGFELDAAALNTATLARNGKP